MGLGCNLPRPSEGLMLRRDWTRCSGLLGGDWGIISKAGATVQWEPRGPLAPLRASWAPCARPRLTLAPGTHDERKLATMLPIFVLLVGDSDSMFASTGPSAITSRTRSVSGVKIRVSL